MRPRSLRWTAPLRRALKWALVFGAYSALVVLKSSIWGFWLLSDLSAGLSAVLSFALALLIGFRINLSYDRWWEARKHWGTLVNVSRNLAIKIRALHRPQAVDRQLARDLIVAYCTGLKDHLRDEPDLGELPGFETDTTTPGHLPSYIARRLYGLFERWEAEGRLTAEQLWVLDAEARVLLDVCGACERIKNTLMSISWRILARQCIAVVLFWLPWLLVKDFGAWTIGLMIVISYFVTAGELIAEVVEEPFGTQEDQLALQAYCEGIDRSVSEVLIERQTESPPPSVVPQT